MIPNLLGNDIEKNYTKTDIKKILQKVSKASDTEINLAETALLLSKYLLPDTNLPLYLSHLLYVQKSLKEALPERTLDIEEKAIFLSKILYKKLSYEGDMMSFDKIENANLASVIDRRKGLPISLGIIYIYAAQTLGWSMEGIQFPGHFLIRLQDESGRLIIDPFHKGEIRRPEELRALIKVSLGPEAELIPEFFETCDNKEIIQRLLNNLKLRLLRASKLDMSIDVLSLMLIFSPKSARLQRQLGLLQAHTGRFKEAIASFEKFLLLNDDKEVKPQEISKTEIRQVMEILSKLKNNKKPNIMGPYDTIF